MVEKAESAVRLAGYDFIPDVEAFARYSFQNNVPFLAGNFGTIGIDSPTTSSTVEKTRNSRRAPSAARSGQGEPGACDRRSGAWRLHRLQQARTDAPDGHRRAGAGCPQGESHRVTAEQLTRGAALRSLALASLAQELDAKAQLLQSRLDYVEAVADLDQATGRTPQ